MASFAELASDGERVVDFLGRQLELKDVCTRLFEQALIDQAAQAHEITVTPDDIQAEAERQRRQQHLEDAQDTYAWLEEQMITPEIWEAGIRDRLLRAAVAQHLFAQQVTPYFIDHRLEFEQITLYRVVVPYSPLAQELFYKIEEDEMSFYEVAHLYDIDAERRLKCGYEGQYHRWALPPDLAATLFGTKPGALIGPMSSEQGHELLLVEERVAAKLTEEIRQLILERLLQDWLARELACQI